MFRNLVFAALTASIAICPGAQFSIEGAVAQAVRHNPDLAAARWSIEEARGRLWHSGRLPNPELESELKPNVKGREFSFSAGFMQKYPLTNRLWLERAISEAGLRAAEAEVRNAERLLRSEVRTASVKLQALSDLKALKETQRTNSTTLAKQAMTAAGVGEGSSLEAAQFELEAQVLSLDLLQVETELVTVTGVLRPLLGLKAGTPVVISGGLPEPTSGRGGIPSVEQRPDYQMARAKEEAARTGIDLARAGKWEDASFGLSYEREHVDDAGFGMERENFIGIKFSLPLPFWNKNEGKIHEAGAAAARARDEKQALALRIRADAAAAIAEMGAAERIIEQTSGPLLKKARELEELQMSANKLGRATLTDVLRAREKRLALEAARLNALRDYHLARVRLMAAQGR